MTIFLCLLIALASPAFALHTPDIKWGMNDASVLMPLADADGEKQLLGAALVGKFGELLPKSVFEAVGPVSPESVDATYEKLRVIAVRIDPCFPGGETPSERCERQIRLVWQPIQSTVTGLRTIDAALHTFYEMPATDFEQLLEKLSTLRRDIGFDSSALPLTVHPLLEKQGLRGRFYLEFKKIILEHIGKSRLTRITFMKVNGAGNVWDFGGFHIRRGELKKISIARVREPIQIFVNSPARPNRFTNSAISPEPRDGENLNLLARDSRKIRPIEDEPVIISSFLAATKMENPHFFSPETMDCVSCHIAQPARIYAAREFESLKLAERAAEFAYGSRTQDLTNVSKQAHVTTNLRSFGYFDREPAISQRTIHETAEVVDRLNAR